MSRRNRSSCIACNSFRVFINVILAPGDFKSSRSGLNYTHPCKERKDGAPSLFVAPAKSKAWAARLRELWDGINPLGVDKGVFVIFRGYIDESLDKDQKYFAIACLLLMGKDWSQLERIWKLRLDSVNKKLKKQHRRTISRYHASDCSGRRKEFKGWTHDERDEFVKDLFQVFKHVAVLSECFDMRLDDLCEVFPEFSADPLRGAYLVSVRAIIELLGQDFYRLSKIRGDDSVRITLFHDRTSNGKYDPVILRAFNQVVLSTWFKFREYFTTIAPMPWERCIALQPADLVAFEACKEAEARAEPRPSRKSFLALVDMKDFGIRLMTFSKTRMQEMRRNMERRGTLPAFLGDV